MYNNIYILLNRLKFFVKASLDVDNIPIYSKDHELY